MTNSLKSLFGLALCALLAPARPAAEAPRAVSAANEIRGIGVSDTAGGVELEIRGTRAPSYTVFKLQDPPRLVVDLAGADVSGVATPVAVRKAGVREVTTAQYQDDRSSVGRVIIGLDAGARYEVAPRGDAVVVKVVQGEVTAATSTTSPPRGGGQAPALRASSEAGTTTAAKPPSDPNVLSRRMDEAEVSHEATAITGARAKSGGVALALNGEVARFEVIELQNPPRLALDLYGIAKAPRAPVLLSGSFTQARFGRDLGKVRVVLDAAGELPRCEVKRVKGGLAVVPMASALAIRTQSQATGGGGQAPALRVERVSVEGQVPAPRVERVEGQVPAPRVERGRLNVAARGSAASADAPRAVVSEAQTAGFTGEAPSYALSGAPQKREYTGRRITLDFHDIEIRNLLRLIADVSKKNVIVADDVSGKVTVSLRNVPWDQALDLVLKTKGLDKEEMGNVIRIAKIEDIAKEQTARAEAAKARAPLIPMKVRLIPVNFARAGELAPRVKDVLSERGSVTTDDRTNVLIVKDIQEALARAEGLVRNLDTEIPQVRIESRIIEAASNINRALGVQWGGNANLSPATGNPTGLFFPNIANTAGASGGGPTQGTAGAPNYAVNLPAAIGQGSGGGLGFTFGSVGGAFNLNLRLSALENSGVVKTISAPSVSTVDNKEATIGQGISIPFSQVSASGVNTVFIEAKLELKVTPHISADGSVLMKIKVTNNSPNPQLTGANGQPSISKREAETEALVKDGDTTVIGGIYTRQTASNVAEVPFFGKIPILGYFFRTKSDSDAHTELLVFITPRILNRQAATAAANGG
jgi:type IV pilus assembly protein PilQ